MISQSGALSRSRQSRTNSSSQETSRNNVKSIRRALPQFIAIGLKNVLLFVYGMTLGYPIIVIPAIHGGDGRKPSNIRLSANEISWFSWINLISVPLGCICSGPFSEYLGKKRSMQIINLPILLSWLLFHFSKNVYYLCIALCLVGLSGGMMEAPVLTYVAEISEPQYRGVLAVSGSICIILGIFFEFILGSLMDWRTIAAVSTVFPTLSIIALFFIPESPIWLIKRKEFQKAIKSLQWLRGWVTEIEIEDEFNLLYEQLIVKTQECENDDDDAGMKRKNNKLAKEISMLKTRSFLKPFLLVLFIFFISHFSGKTALQTYAVQIFHSLKAPVNKYHATILLGLAELFGTIFCIIFIHITGRRPLLFLSTIGCGLCYFGTAMYAFLLNVVPGFGVNNVVINASSLTSKESVISLNNFTEAAKSDGSSILIEEPLNNINWYNYQLIPSNNSALLENVTTIYPDDPFANEIEYDYDKNNSGFKESDLQYNYTAFTDIFTNLTQDIRVLPMSPRKVLNAIENEILLPSPKRQHQNEFLWIPILLLLGATFFAHIGIRIIPWLLIMEIYPVSIRNTGSGLSSASGYICGFLANKSFLKMLPILKIPGTFLSFSAIAIVGTIVLHFIMPETEGKTLWEIEQQFIGTTIGEVEKDETNQNIEMNTSISDRSLKNKLNQNNLYTIEEAEEPNSQITHRKCAINKAFENSESFPGNSTTWL